MLALLLSRSPALSAFAESILSDLYIIQIIFIILFSFIFIFFENRIPVETLNFRNTSSTYSFLCIIYYMTIIYYSIPESNKTQC